MFGAAFTPKTLLLSLLRPTRVYFILFRVNPLAAPVDYKNRRESRAAFSAKIRGDIN